MHLREIEDAKYINFTWQELIQHWGIQKCVSLKRITLVKFVWLPAGLFYLSSVDFANFYTFVRDGETQKMKKKRKKNINFISQEYDWNIQREGIGHASASNLNTDPIKSLTNLCPPVEKIAGPVSFPLCVFGLSFLLGRPIERQID